MIPKVKSVYGSKVDCNPREDQSNRGEFTPGKLPRGGMNTVWNFSDKPNGYCMNNDSSGTKPEK